VDQFNAVSKLIYQRLGLAFDDKKVYFLQKRVEKRMQTLGIQTAEQYIFMLGYADPDGTEMQALANLVTTNETYMFREYEQLEAFANHCLPEVLSKKQDKGERTLRIWSAGCSSGEEPYSLAIIVKEVFPQIQSWNFEVHATDIDEIVLARARAARYGPRAVKEVPPGYLERHFVPNGETYTVHPRTAAAVNIRHLNLHDRMGMRAMRNFDFIFCRNVLIYFDDQSRKTALDHFYNALNPGGYIFLGHSESVGRITSAFRLRRIEQHLVYMKE
jgi:chemotaxis protein methyltransferase CheR